jgi:hypothetical protein
MPANKSNLRRLFSFCALVFATGFLSVRAQQGTLEEIKYKEDYDRIQQIIKVNNLVRRSDQIVSLYKDRRDMDPKLQQYIDGIFTKDMEDLLKQDDSIAVRGLCEKALQVRPKFGEVYLYYGVALKNEKKIDEAMNALAKGSLIRNRLQTRAKQQLDLIYRANNKGSLVGENKIIAKAKAELR